VYERYRKGRKGNIEKGVREGKKMVNNKGQ